MRQLMIPVALSLIAVVPAAARADTASDEASIRQILAEEVTTWNRGDAEGYSRHFAPTGAFTNVQGMFFSGRQAFLDRHVEIFKGVFHGTTLQLKAVALRFVAPNVVAVDSLTWVSNFSPAGPPATLRLDEKGRLRTRLFQLFVKRGSDWQLEVYHNTDIKPTIPAPEPD